MRCYDVALATFGFFDQAILKSADFLAPIVLTPWVQRLVKPCKEEVTGWAEDRGLGSLATFRTGACAFGIVDVDGMNAPMIVCASADGITFDQYLTALTERWAFLVQTKAVKPNAGGE